jgi:hypothetical protein
MEVARTECRHRRPQIAGRVRRALAAALTALVALTHFPVLAASGTGSNRASASLDIRIVIPPVLRLKTLRSPPQLIVTARDVAAGYVDVERGMEVELLSNMRNGHALQFLLASSIVRAAEISGLGEPVQVDDSTTQVTFRRAPGGATRTTLNLGFRLRLAANAQPGVYQWPVSMTLTPA